MRVGRKCSSITAPSAAMAIRPSQRVRRSSSKRLRAQKALRPRTSRSLRSRGFRNVTGALCAPVHFFHGRGERMAEKEEKIEGEGEGLESFRAGMYRIRLQNRQQTLPYSGSQIRRYRIRIAPGDHGPVE